MSIFTNPRISSSGNCRIRKRQGCQNQRKKAPARPKLKLLGHDGNIYSILGDARRLLLRNGQSKEASEMTERVNQSGNYYQALGIISEYVEN